MKGKSEAGALIEQIITIEDAACAQAVFGPLHRHLAMIQEDFREGGGPAGYAVQVDARGCDVVLRAGPDRGEEQARAAQVVHSLIALWARKRRVREAEVSAALAFSRQGGSGEADAPRELPQLGSLILRTPKQLRYAQALGDPRADLIFGVGAAGTGKTYLAVAAAVRALREEQVDRIVVTRPAVEAGERLGFLPGDLAEKVDPYLQPIWDAFREQLGESELRARRERRQVEVAPVAFMRGRTLSNAFVIIDEAQNATALQMKMLLTRLGEGSRMVVTGDPSQVDLPRHELSGLAHALGLLEGEAGVEVVRFEAGDVVRHRLVSRIIAAYEADAARRSPQGGGGRHG